MRGLPAPLNTGTAHAPAAAAAGYDRPHAALGHGKCELPVRVYMLCLGSFRIGKSLILAAMDMESQRIPPQAKPLISLNCHPFVAQRRIKRG